MQLSHVFKIIVKRYITLMDSGKHSEVMLVWCT